MVVVVVVAEMVVELVMCDVFVVVVLEVLVAAVEIVMESGMCDLVVAAVVVMLEVAMADEV